MTNPLYKSLQVLAGTQLKAFGQSVTLRRRDEGVYDPLTAKTLGPSVTDFAVSAVINPYSDKRIDGTLIKAGDLQAYIPAKGLTITPQAMDRLVVDGVEYTVVRADQTNPGGLQLLHTLQLRRGT